MSLFGEDRIKTDVMMVFYIRRRTFRNPEPGVNHFRRTGSNLQKKEHFKWVFKDK